MNLFLNVKIFSTFSNNPVWNEHNKRPTMPRVQAGKVKHELFCGLRNEPASARFKYDLD